MKFLLLKMKVNGIKNIDKEIELQFHNSTWKDLKNSFNESHIKAIYGTNGAGKTGIIHSINLYRNLLINKNYLTLENANNGFKNLINQKTKKFTIEVVFACHNKIEKDDYITNVYSHYLCIEEKNSYFKITEEKISLVNGNNLNCEEKYTTLFHSKNGEIKNLYELINEPLKNIIIKSTMNLLEFNSFINIFTNMQIDGKILNLYDKEESNLDFFIHMGLLLVFSIELTIVLQDSDLNYINLKSISEQIKTITNFKKSIKNKKIFDQLLTADRISQSNARYILKRDFKDFQTHINKLVNFIKVFKNDLNSIEIKKDDFDIYYVCELILIYNDGRKINEKYESNGIKKIIELYGALCDIDEGKIVFIDEFDSNIHDVLLSKLIEYALLYTNGQFIFTTHNLGLMEILKGSKHSIDFLSNDSKITSWVKNGNYSPVNIYKKGLIESSPFNLEPFNFLGVFSGETDE